MIMKPIKQISYKFDNKYGRQTKNKIIKVMIIMLL